MGETNDPLVEMLDIGVRHVRKILIEDRGELSRFYHLVAGKPGEQDRIIVARWKNDVERQLAVIEVKNHARQIDAVRALFVGGGWMLQMQGVVDRAQVDKVLAYGPVREHPQRIEVVQLAAFDGERTKARLLRVVRDRPGGRIVALEPDRETDHFEGHLVDGIIPKPGEP